VPAVGVEPTRAEAQMLARPPRLPIDFRALNAGYTRLCGIVTSGAAFCFGSNGAGQLGNGTTTSSNSPVVVSGNLEFTNLAGGRSHTCGRTTSGAVYCWGGNGSNDQSSVPVPVLPFGASPAR
jgi:alpha-tubulin suppressor-like RCC1 family protein